MDENNLNLNQEPEMEVKEETAEEIPETAAEEILEETLGETQEEKPAAKKKSWKKELREWMVSIAAALMIVFFIRTFLFQIIRVDGASMSTTLLDGERLYVSVLDMKLNDPQRGDIVICHYPNRGKTNFVKRVVGVPGDKVCRLQGVTRIIYEVTDENGEVKTVEDMMDDRWAIYFPYGSTEDYEPYTLGEDEYFVVGDNRYNSHDSRDWNDASPANDVGPITGDMIIGKVRTVIWPISEIRNVG